MMHLNPVELITPEYRELIETANLDWQVAQYVRWMDQLAEHSANEVKAAAIRQIARRQHGPEFDRAVAAYRPSAVEQVLEEGGYTNAWPTK